VRSVLAARTISKESSSVLPHADAAKKQRAKSNPTEGRHGWSAMLLLAAALLNARAAWRDNRLAASQCGNQRGDLLRATAGVFIALVRNASENKFRLFSVRKVRFARGFASMAALRSAGMVDAVVARRGA
jgi:hypothetical protein